MEQLDLFAPACGHTGTCIHAGPDTEIVSIDDDSVEATTRMFADQLTELPGETWEDIFGG